MKTFTRFATDYIRNHIVSDAIDLHVINLPIDWSILIPFTDLSEPIPSNIGSYHVEGIDAYEVNGEKEHRELILFECSPVVREVMTVTIKHETDFTVVDITRNRYYETEIETNGVFGVILQKNLIFTLAEGKVTSIGSYYHIGFENDNPFLNRKSFVSVLLGDDRLLRVNAIDIDPIFFINFNIITLASRCNFLKNRNKIDIDCKYNSPLFGSRVNNKSNDVLYRETVFKEEGYFFEMTTDVDDFKKEAMAFILNTAKYENYIQRIMSEELNGKQTKQSVIRISIDNLLEL